MKRGWIDKGLGKLASRKLLVWMTSVAALFLDKVSGEEFIYISMLYILSQGAVDAIVRLKASGSGLLP